MTLRRRPSSIAALLFAALLLSRAALAQGDVVARAQSLFEEGRALMAEGRHAEACPKLEESQRLDPGGGTLLNLAACHRKIGRTATAWAEYKEALGIARSDGREDRVVEATARIAELEPHLSRVRITVSSDNPPDLVIRQNGFVFGRGSWGTAVPQDPASYRVSAEAPGKRPWEAIVELKPDGGVVELVVPRLEDLPESKPPPAGPKPLPQPVARAAPEPRSSVDSASGPPPLAWVAFGVGAAGLGIGTYFGLRALDQKRESDSICDQEECPQSRSRAVDLNDKANSSAWISNVAFAVGLAGAATGAVLWITDQRAARSPRAGVALTPGSLRVTLQF